MTIHHIPVREVPETPEETEFLNAKSWEKPMKPTVGMLYQEYKLVVGILIGCLVMGVVASYFNSRNFGVLNNNITRNQELATAMERNTETCKALVEKNATMLLEYRVNSASIVAEVADKLIRKTSKVVEDKEVPNK